MQGRAVLSACEDRPKAAALLDLVEALIPSGSDCLFVHAGSAIANAVPPTEKASPAKNALFGLREDGWTSASQRSFVCMPRLHTALALHKHLLY